MPVQSVAAPGSGGSEGAARDRWPHTGRLLPWLVALLLTAICLLPIDSSTLGVSLPVDPKVDRVLLGVIGGYWMLAIWAGGAMAPTMPRMAVFGVALLAWVLVAFLSIVAALPTLVINNELALTIKRMLLLFAYVSFFLLVASSIRPSEVRSLISLWIGAGGVLAVGALYSFWSGSDPFRDITRSLLGGAFLVGAGGPVSSAGGAPSVMGPTLHPLALTTMLVMPMPFVLQRAWAEPRPDRQAGYWALLLLFAVASVTTGRKSSIVVPLVMGAVMLAYRPRRVLRLWPALLGFVALAQVVAPGALTTIVARADPNNTAASQSTKDRIDDWGGSVPDLLAHPWLGKGYGSNDPGTYRVLDNQWLSSAVETGLLGVLAQLALLVAAFAFAHRLARSSSDPDVRGQGVAAASAIVAFAVSMALYDALGFVQGVYLVFWVTALTVVLKRGEDERLAASGAVPAPPTRRWAAPWRRLIADRAKWRRLGVPVAIVLGLCSVLSISTTAPFVRLRSFQSHTASTTLTIDTRPSATIDSEAYLGGVLTDARIVERIAWSPATLRRIAGRLNIPPNDLLGTATPGVREQLSERGFGSREQRSYAVVRQGSPYEVSLDPFVSDPLLRATVRGPSTQAAEAVMNALPDAVNAQLDALAGAPTYRRRLTVEDLPGSYLAVRGPSVGVVFGLSAVVYYLFWLALGGVLRANLAPLRSQARRASGAPQARAEEVV
jgi:O-Antigen ligase